MVIRFIFCHSDGLLNEIVGGLVKQVTHSLFSHVAVGFEDYLVEATVKGVWTAELNKYDKAPILKIIQVNVTEEQHKLAKDTADKLLGYLYGFDDCVIGGLRDTLGDIFSDIAAYFDLRKTLDCSAVATIIGRCIWPEFLAGDEYCEITPERLYEELLRYI